MIFYYFAMPLTFTVCYFHNENSEKRNKQSHKGPLVHNECGQAKIYKITLITNTKLFLNS